MLVVNDDEPVNVQVEPNDRLLFPRLDRGDVIRGTTSGDRTIGLNLERPLYLGGVDPFETINPNAGTSDGFVGCIGELKVGDKTTQLFEDALESLNIEDCGDRRLCERRPCHNNARCIDVSPTEYRCLCTPQFTGTDCKTEINVCVTHQPCQNGGRCVVVGSSYRCDCPVPWIGNNCHLQASISTNINVDGNGYAEFHKERFPHPRRSAAEIISLTITTTHSDGLFFWQGQQPGEQGGKDYLALALKDGYVQFGYELGSGAALIQSSETVDDGFPHRVVVERLGRNGSVSIDNRTPVIGESRGSLQVLNVPGNIFFGGVPDLNRYTNALFRENFAGCLSDVKLQNNLLDFGTDAVKGFNIEPCSPSL
uniref:Basement membrane-specific heparan sulfate proteoglycan core protein n=1 Tax=Arion vulgaris TaxID=1028688 RepID=A0A0B7AVZ7_9EUPU